MKDICMEKSIPSEMFRILENFPTKDSLSLLVLLQRLRNGFADAGSGPPSC